MTNSITVDYYASSYNMGDTPENLCEAFREWAKNHIQKELAGRMEIELNQITVEVYNEEKINLEQNPVCVSGDFDLIEQANKELEWIDPWSNANWEEIENLAS